MKPKAQLPRKNLLRGHAVAAVVLLVLAAVMGSGALATVVFTNQYVGKIYPGVRISDTDVGGKSPEEAKKIIQQKTYAYMRKGITFVSEGREVAINPMIIAPGDPDFYYELISFDLDKTVRVAMSIGRDKNPLVSWYDLAATQVRGRNVLLSYNLDREAIGQALHENFDTLADPPQNARPLVQFRDEEIYVAVLPEKSGVVFDYDEAIKKLQTGIPRLQTARLAIASRQVEPEVRAAQVEHLLPEVKKLFARGT